MLLFSGTKVVGVFRLYGIVFPNWQWGKSYLCFCGV